ncbi:MAG: RNA 2',3'-cyclic phosphodiesterase [Nanoarchaeota archaeon]|nr:RNA 2',3'-cyclic phosphodiesterase [Nanoarchaeota archaeon]
MRVFVAIDLPEDVKNKISEFINGFDKNVADIKFVDPKNLHITLKFLGEVREDSVKQIVNVLSDYVPKSFSYKLHIAGFGFFGSPKFIRALWLGLKEGKNETIQIMKDLNKKLDHIRHEDYDLSPHLTIGRVRNSHDADALLSQIRKLADVKIGEIQVDTIKLKKSFLTPEGPMYNDIELFQLGG